MKKILLMGNPNVGKSALFSRLTGVDVAISNYPGTTVEFKKGKTRIGRETAELIDVPGTYGLKATCKAEEIASCMVKEGDLVINIVDATNLERNLYLTLQLLEENIPVVVALNFWDETKHQGINIDAERLEELLDVPVVPTVAVTGEGIKELVSRFKDARGHRRKHSDKERWARIGGIVDEAQNIAPRDHKLSERLEELTIKSLTGIPIALLVLALVFWSVMFIGEGLITYVFDPMFGLYMPVAEGLSEALGPGLAHDLLVGNLINGQIDFGQSMGLLTTGLFVPFAMVLPYIIAFYLALSILEDCGYLPRLATLVDSVMHRMGLHGLSIIPMMLGAGCNVPGVLSTRILETKRQRFIAMTMMSIAIPCMAQSAMVFALLGPYGMQGLGILFATLFIVWLGLGLVLNKVMKGITPETFMEITPYRVPYLRGLAKKLWMRIRFFLKEAIPFVLLGILFVNLLYITGVMDVVGKVMSPVVTGVLGLPEGASASLMTGFLRKDVAVGMLLPLGMNMKQLIIASVMLTMYFPCIATFVVMFKELGAKDLLKAALIMVAVSLLVGGALNLVL